MRLLASSLRFALTSAGLGLGFIAVTGSVALAAPPVSPPPAMSAAGVSLPLYAENPVDFGNGYIIDQAGALSSADETELATVLAELRAKTGVSLFVTYVDSFDNPTDASAWAEQTAIDNNLGRLGVLLAVAVDDREYGFSFDQNFPLNSATTDDIEAKYLLPQLGQDQWLGAAVHYANGLAEGFGTPLGSAPDPSESNEGSAAAWIGFVAIAGIGGGSWYLIHRSLKKRRVSSGEDVQALSPAELKRKVASALIELDDAIKLSEQELGFAVAQFGESETQQFTQALTLAKAHIHEAFKLKLLLDDKTPDTDAQIREWSTEILRLCQEADAALEAQEQAFENLRQLEQNAPELLAAVGAKLQQAQQETVETRSLLPQLSRQYAEEALASVAENPQQAEALSQFANEQLTAASEHVSAGRTSQAALSLRAAEQSVDQVEALNRAVVEIGPALEKAGSELATLKADLQQDILNAEQLLSKARANGDVVPSGQELLQLKQQTRTALAQAQGRDPVTELALLEDINIHIDQLFATTKNQLLDKQRVRDHLQRALSTASTSIAETERFITTRRGAVGVDARTHLAEANRLLGEATRLASPQPDQALQYANQAIIAAQNAGRMATADVRTQTSYQSSSAGPELGGILGSILGSMIGSSLGGRGRNSGWGGGSSRPNRSSRGFGGFGGGRSGGFGGSGGRSSSSRSSGGRRSGGGRF